MSFLKVLISVTIFFVGFIYLIKLQSFLFPPDPSDLSYEEKLERNCQSVVESEYLSSLKKAQQNGVSWLLANGYESVVDYARETSQLYIQLHPDCVQWNNLKSRNSQF